MPAVCAVAEVLPLGPIKIPLSLVEIAAAGIFAVSAAITSIESAPATTESAANFEIVFDLVLPFAEVSSETATQDCVA